MKSERSTPPPRQNWEALRNDIEKWYVTEDMPVKYVRQQLSRRNFHVSERQIKSKLEKWKLQCKRTPHAHYMAMMAVVDDYNSQGTEIEFFVLKGLREVVYTKQKIKKECRC
ncbi:uncharacterized protein PV07_12738 [Cladophialophora immunda]|uniref:Clr5 domain-containing protein n=1 Tax=Cladophialophora immunda TaxID=569365 RepID=A0A0D1Z2E0_9EURO|nr:uncharacterized protein PV07_12738 [Cladophialophora immunda]KIW21836.1 hypothetical protein PV07_12738 [Cladophialophora immunda]